MENKKKNSSEAVVKETKSKIKIKKQYVWIGAAVALVLVVVLAFFIFGNKDSKPAGSADSSAQSVSSSAAPEEIPASSDASVTSAGDLVPQPADKADAPTGNSQTEEPSQEVAPKYEGVEIYEKNGKKYAKTEDGTEVELSGENLQYLMGEYAKVQGTGSQREKELLDQMQIILDNADKLAEQ